MAAAIETYFTIVKLSDFGVVFRPAGLVAVIANMWGPG